MGRLSKFFYIHLTLLQLQLERVFPKFTLHIRFILGLRVKIQLLKVRK